MKAGIVLAGLVLAVASTTLAKDPPSYEKGRVLSMDSKPCGYQQKDQKSITGEILGTDTQNKKTQEVLCQDYVLQTDRMVYHVRPLDLKHPDLLPVGDAVEFRIHKGKMLLVSPETNQKEHEYQVISVALRSEAKDDKVAQK